MAQNFLTNLKRWISKRRVVLVLSVRRGDTSAKEVS